MNILTEPLADYVEIGGVRYAVQTDFKNWIRIGSLMRCPDAENGAHLAEALGLCYVRGSLPPSLEDAVFAMLRFYIGEEEGQAARQGRAKCTAVYDFEYDAEYIFAAFWAQYGLDLTKCRLHWHAFRALFLGLCGEHKICRMMEYRGADLSQIKNKEQKSFYRKMQRLYRLPDMRTQAQREADMMAAFSSGF